MAEVMSSGDDTDRFARLTALNHEFGVEHHPELIAGLRARHGL